MPRIKAKPEAPTEGLTIVQRVRSHGSGMSITKLAKITGLGRNTLYVMVRAGRIPSIKVGTNWVLDPILIADWLEERSTYPPG